MQLLVAYQDDPAGSNMANFISQDMKKDGEIFRGKYFDVVTCSFGLFFLPDMQAGLKAIKFGLAANRPVTPGSDSWFYAYFATDSGVLSCWDGSAWLTTILT